MAVAEVKNLANQTAKATEDISKQISGVQEATQDAVKVIGKINEISSAIARRSE